MHTSALKQTIVGLAPSALFLIAFFAVLGTSYTLIPILVIPFGTFFYTGFF